MTLSPYRLRDILWRPLRFRKQLEAENEKRSEGKEEASCAMREERRKGWVPFFVTASCVSHEPLGHSKSSENTAASMIPGAQ
jgi:hypothetical protein